MNRLVILNPKSRHGKAAREFENVRPELEASWGEFQLYRTTSPGDATTRTREAIKSGVFDQIVAAGGDGTVNEVVNGYFEDGRILTDGIPLAVVDLGTGGDLFRTIKRSSPDYKEACRTGRFRKIDSGLVAAGNGTSHHFLNISSAGLAGYMLERLKRSRFQTGAPAYFYHTVSSLLAYDSPEVEVELDGEKREIDLVNLFVCNGCFSGGGMEWAPNADLCSGRFQVTMIEGKRKWPLILQSRKLYTGRISEYPGFSQRGAEEVSIRTTKEISGEADGEVLGIASEFRYSIQKGIFPVVM